HPYRHVEKGRWRGDLRRPVRQPAIPESTGHTHLERIADQEHAGAAMARSEKAADSPGFKRLQIRLGRLPPLRRARNRRSHDAERPTHRSCVELSRYGE